MCGIAGIINFNSPEDMRDLLSRMLGFIRHRGPDAAGIYVNGPAGLGHARLSIIDLSGGDQPICNEDKTVWIVFNGEVFNYPELRRSLKDRGHRFYTQTDTEVLVHLYEEHGPDLFKEINGQYAFAIWDKNKETLLLGRDRMGIRPLFYYHQGGRLVFGSEVKAIFADPSIPHRLDCQSLSDIFTCWSPLGTATTFEDIYLLPPAHYGLFSRQGMTIKPYWQLPFGRPAEPDRSLADCTEELSRLFHDAVRIRLRADVPVGAYLSGGLDSTYTSSLIKHRFNNRLHTFSISFADKRFDESAYQAIAAKHIQTDHQNVHCTEDDIGTDFPKIIWHTETPIIRTAPAPLYRLSRLVRESSYKVVLTGEGADEVFAGYNIFKEDKVRRFWARHPDSALRPRLLERLYPYIFAQGGRAKAFLEGFFKKGLSEVDLPVYSHMVRWQNTSQLKSFLSEEAKGKAQDLNQFIDRYTATLPPDFGTWEPLAKAQYIESDIFLPNYLLASQGDRMAMANAVEGRYPFLDHRIVEFAAQLPGRYRLNGLTEKFILKQAAQDLIPRELVTRPKQPYRAPISTCFAGQTAYDYVQELLSEEIIKEYGYFNPKRVSTLLKKCQSRKGDLLSERENMALVGILSTQLAAHHFVHHFPFQSGGHWEEIKVYP